MSILVTIILDGQPQISRRLPAIPRDGDFIELGITEKKREVRVTHVVWRHCNVPDDCHVDVFCRSET